MADQVLGATLGGAEPAGLRKEDFEGLMPLFSRTKYEVRGTPMRDRLNLVCLVANVAKHQGGPALDELVALRGDLFVRRRDGVEMRVGRFEEAFEAIDDFWADYGEVFRVL